MLVNLSLSSESKTDFTKLQPQTEKGGKVFPNRRIWWRFTQPGFCVSRKRHIVHFSPHPVYRCLARAGPHQVHGMTAFSGNRKWWFRDWIYEPNSLGSNPGLVTQFLHSFKPVSTPIKQRWWLYLNLWAVVRTERNRVGNMLSPVWYIVMCSKNESYYYKF